MLSLPGQHVGACCEVRMAHGDAARIKPKIVGLSCKMQTCGYFQLAAYSAAY